MKKDIRGQAAEMEMISEKVDTIIKYLEKMVDGDPIVYGKAMEMLRQTMHQGGLAAGADGAMFEFTDMEDFREKFVETMSGIKIVSFFNHKYADFFSEIPTPAEMEEYIQDCRWVLPTIKKVYGEGSEQYEAISFFANFDFDSVNEDEEE